MTSWRRKTGIEDLEVGAAFYRRATPRRTELIVVTKAGRFGYEWLVGYEVARR